MERGFFMKQDMIVILDLGSRENTRLARMIRELGVYSEIYPHDITLDGLKAINNVKGVIVNGGPNNIVDGKQISVLDDVMNCGIPRLCSDYDGAPPIMGENDEETFAALKSFLFDKCNARPNWNMDNFISDQVELIRQQVGDKKVLLALSGGVENVIAFGRLR